MKRFVVLFLAFVFGGTATLVTAHFAFAVGGGGWPGNTNNLTPACTTDDWTCGDWGSCNADNTQSRTCTLANDCAYASTTPETSRACASPCLIDDWQCSPWSSCGSGGSQSRSCVLVNDCASVDTPKPIDHQTCQQDCTADAYTCTDWGTCNLDGKQSRTCTKSFDCPSIDTPPPDQEQSCTPTCTEDTWSCTDWGSCDDSGNAHRTCTMTADCAATDTPKPIEEQLCQTLQCADLPELRDRVACRLKLTPAGLSRELDLSYMPEVCAGLTGDDQATCVSNYKDFQQCWNFPPGQERFGCASHVVGITDIQTMHDACMTQTGDAATACLADLQKKTYALIEFRMDDLEQRAEDFLQSGVKVDTIVNFDLAVIQHTIDFHAATTYDARKAIIEDLQTTWQTLVSDVQTQLQSS